MNHRNIRLLAGMLLLALVLLAACGQTGQEPPQTVQPPAADPGQTPPEPTPAAPAPAEPEPAPATPETPPPTNRHPAAEDFTAAPETVNGAAYQRWTVRFFSGDSPYYPTEGDILLPEGAQPLMVEKFNPPDTGNLLAVCLENGRYQLYAATDPQTPASVIPLAPIEGDYLTAAPVAIIGGGGSGELGVIFELDCGGYYRYVSYDNWEWSGEADAFDFIYRGDMALDALLIQTEAIETDFLNPAVYQGLASDHGLSSFYSLEELRAGIDALNLWIDDGDGGIAQWELALLEEDPYKDDPEAFFSDIPNIQVYYDEARQREYVQAHPEDEGKVLLLSSRLCFSWDAETNRYPKIPCYWTLRRENGGDWQIQSVNVEAE